MSRGPSHAGFTLLEMIVAINIFVAAFMITGGIITAAVSAQRKTTEFRRVQDNARFALEHLSKELRTGKEMVLLDAGGGPCAGWCPRIRFCNDRGERIEYSVASDIFVRSHAAVGANCFGVLSSPSIDMTSDEMRVASVLFNLIGGIPGPSDGQPRITIVFRAASVMGAVKVQVNMNFQTTVVQRLRDY